ncbi:MAG TPA: LysM peptidoglycan-binding domain-containing protein [Thermomicrobiaceae bacterium]|nr:LysM peptidoglycan-binding domain-containing protein [Thermomicrobiaceae bacterium]
MAKLARWKRIAAGAVVCGVLLTTPLSAMAASAQTHTVARGETLWGIASSYGVSVESIAQLNGISNINLIYVGEQLSIPGTGSGGGSYSVVPASLTTASGASAGSSSSYTVQPGDTLWGIAVNLGVSVQSLIAANPSIGNQNLIYAGETLSLPGSTPGSASSSGSSIASVVPAAEVKQLLDQYASVYGLDPLLVEAIAWQESGWQQGVVSSAGALGVMQLLPSTANWIAADVVGQPLDVANSVNDNILAGCANLAWLINYYGSTSMGVAAYYQGAGNIAALGILPETNQYVQSVMAIRSYIAQYGVPPSS